MHAKVAKEPYARSPLRELGKGLAEPAGWGVSLLSAAGLKSSDQPNQDSFSYTTLQSGWLLCVVCDGHGDRGEVISSRVSRMLPYLLSQKIETEELSLPEALVPAFLAAQADLERNFGPAQVYSGATVALLCVREDGSSAWVAHAGDSRVVLADLAQNTVLFESDEHKAHDPEENCRLRAAGAQIIQKTYENGELVSRVFVPRTGVPGLAMSRSLGDGCLKKYGVTAEPEVRDISDLWHACDAPAVVLASDGLWDTFSAEETVKELSRLRAGGGDVLLGVEDLCGRSQQRWIQMEGDYCDDITILCVAPRSSLGPLECGHKQ